MPQFRYFARKSDGKLMDGVLTCNDRASAIMQVESQGGVPIKIEPINGAASSSVATTKSNPLSTPVSSGPVQTIAHTHLYLFTEQLAHLLSAGMTLDEALGILVKRLKHPRLQGL